MELDIALAARRSIRRYKPDPIDERTLNHILESVRIAPSWANTQCWKLIVVKDKAIKEKLAGTMFSFRGGVNQTAEGMKVAPIAIAFCAELNKSGFSYAEPKQTVTDKGEHWYMFDTALAMENFCLAAVSHGLGTVIIGAFDARAAAEVLKVPAGYAVVALTPLGYPDEAPESRPRKDMADMVCYDQFEGK